MDFYFIEPDGSKFHLPVNPEEVGIMRGKGLETVQIIGKGEVDFPSGQKVREIAFSSFFPKFYDASYCKYTELPEPQTAMNRFTTWMNAKTPVRLLISETAVNILVLISAHNSTFKGGEPGDVYYELKCRTWTNVRVRSVNSGESAAGSGQRRNDVKPVPKTYTVKAGDSLWLIAKLVYGNGQRWKDIYERNRKLIGPSPDLILPGQKLVMPA